MAERQNTVPLLGFCAYGSGAGKTTLLTALVPILTERGVRISIVKHAHHSFDIDKPGKDSYRLREAGAVQMMIGSLNRWALMTERSRTPAADREPELAELIAQMDPRLADLIMVEGFKQAAIPKIEIHRPSTSMPLLADNDPSIIAIACDSALSHSLPVLDLNQPEAIADYIQDWLRANAA